MLETGMEPEYLHPLLDYLKAKEFHRQGETDEATKALERAFGSEDPNPFLRQNLDIALDKSKTAGNVVLDGIYGEMKWIQRQTATPRKSQG
jgi:hypothetical protein